MGVLIVHIRIIRVLWLIWQLFGNLQLLLLRSSIFDIFGKIFNLVQIELVLHFLKINVKNSLRCWSKIKSLLPIFFTFISCTIFHRHQNHRSAAPKLKHVLKNIAGKKNLVSNDFRNSDTCRLQLYTVVEIMTSHF